MLIVGLTGSIGMGKTTTASMFANLGASVHDADAAVHALYQERNMIAALTAEFGDILSEDAGAVDRKKLAAIVVGNPRAMARLEAIVHPAVSEIRRKFIAQARADKENYVILDIPLLFETGSDRLCDKIIVVTADHEIQRNRVLSRPSMTPEKFDAILAKQLPDIQKQARADYIVDTTHGMDSARAQVRAIHDDLTSAPNHT